MAIIFAITKLHDDVVAQFAADGTNVPNYFGWRESAQHRAGPRIVWIPGDANGSLGALGPARFPGRDPRPLATLFELVTVEISAHNPLAAENERAQYQVVRELFDAWYRAVHLAAHGTFQIVSSNWIAEKKERRHGAALRVVLAVQAMIPDEPAEFAPVDTSAVIDVAELDHEETITASPGDTE